MKLQLKSLLMMGALVCSLGFMTSCGGGDDDDNTPNNGGSTVQVSQILGSWYVTEQSAEKLLVDVIQFNSNNTGVFTEIKAKAKTNWQPTTEPMPFTWTLNGNHVTMLFNHQGQQETREGDIVMNSDGTATVTRKTDDGSSTVTMIMRRLNGKTGMDIMNQLLAGIQQGTSVEAPPYIGLWEYANGNNREIWEITQTTIKWMQTYLSYDEDPNGKLVGSGTFGTFEVVSVEGQKAFNCHWSHFLTCTDPANAIFEMGNPTGRETQDYIIKYTYDSQNDQLYLDMLKNPLSRKK